MKTMTLGIIGTAGRGPDGETLKQNLAWWRMMKSVAQTVCVVIKPDSLVSGGAAYADHFAVQLFLEDYAPSLSLHFPAEFTPFGFKETSSKFDCGRTSNYYHNLFEKDQGVHSLVEIQSAIEKGAEITVGTSGFKERNTVVANEAHCMLAFTFGEGPRLKDGGTLDTMTKFIARRNKGGGSFRAFHFDLNSKRLYEI